MSSRVDLDSTVFRSALYEHRTSALELHFNDGTVYRYADVPERVYLDFTESDSKGRYFNTQIRTRYRHSRLETAAPAQLGTAVRS